MLIKYDPKKYALKVEIKRLREALERIVPMSKMPYMNELVMEIAEQALKGDE